MIAVLLCIAQCSVYCILYMSFGCVGFNLILPHKVIALVAQLIWHLLYVGVVFTFSTTVHVAVASFYFSNVMELLLLVQCKGEVCSFVFLDSVRCYAVYYSPPTLHSLSKEEEGEGGRLFFSKYFTQCVYILIFL